MGYDIVYSGTCVPTYVSGEPAALVIRAEEHLTIKTTHYTA
jgi:hypothetical protein